MSRKVDHWDCSIRELAAKTLHNLTAKVRGMHSGVWFRLYGFDF